jgi:4'-phosphopantetheinyl transferase
MRDLGPTQIHLWCWPFGTLPIAQCIAYAMTILSDAEKHKCAEFYFEKQRAEYAVSHAIVRLMLSEYAPVRPQEWQFLRGPWGKPQIAGPELRAPLWFNLSRTEGCFAFVAGRVARLGVDVESVNRAVSCGEIAKHCFAANEYEHLSGLPASLQREAFFRIWTLKEAYTKAEGKGLSIPLNSFHFRFHADDPSAATLVLSNGPSARDWKFFERRIATEYRISLGVHTPVGAHLELQCHEAHSFFNGA